MKVSQEYKEANGLTPEKIAETMMTFYRAVDAHSQEILERLKEHGIELNCHAGCCRCCRDELSMTQAEAAVIRKYFPKIGQEKAHAVGACAFLDENGLCRIYEARPYICRTHGLPMRSWISAQEAVEMGLASDDEVQEECEVRDICDVNENCLDIMEIPDDACWTVGVAEAKIVAMDLCTFGECNRVFMRSFFQN